MLVLTKTALGARAACGPRSRVQHRTAPSVRVQASSGGSSSLSSRVKDYAILSFWPAEAPARPGGRRHGRGSPSCICPNTQALTCTRQPSLGADDETKKHGAPSASGQSKWAVSHVWAQRLCRLVPLGCMLWMGSARMINGEIMYLSGSACLLSQPHLPTTFLQAPQPQPPCCLPSNFSMRPQGHLPPSCPQSLSQSTAFPGNGVSGMQRLGRGCEMR